MTLVELTILGAVVGIWLFMAALFGAVLGKSGRRRIGAASSVLLVVSATLTAAILPLLWQAPWTSPADNPVANFLAGLAVAPFAFGFLLVYDRLIVAVGVLVLALAINTYLSRRLPPRPAFIAAVLIGCAAPMLAIGAQSVWSMAAMARGADALQVDCVQRRSLLEIVAQGAPIVSAKGQLFNRHHGLARKGDQVWYWSFRAAAWIAYDPQNSTNRADPRPLISCPN